MSGLPNADHHMVSMQVINGDASSMGRGRWSIPAHLLKDRLLAKYINKCGTEALNKIKNLKGECTESMNPQTLSHSFKKNITEMARKRECIVPKILKEIQETEANLELLLTNNDAEKDINGKVKEAEELTKRLADLKRKQHLKK